jgi:hypothetical protein
MTKRHRVIALALGSALAVATVASPALANGDFTGTYQTQSGAVGGRGAGSIQMTISQRGTSLTWSTSTGYTYICSLQGTTCSGTWSGKTGSGWFDVKFTPNGDRFAGNWGYGNDRTESGSFSGTRK